MQNDLLFIQNTSTDSTEYEEKFVNLTANKVVFVDTNNLPTTAGIGLSTQFLKADGSLDSTTYEPILPEIPVNPDNKYLNGNRLWSEISIGAGGYAGNVYASNIDSNVPGYKTMSYTLDSTESVRSIIVNNNTILSETCLYDSEVGVTVIPSGLWKATFYAKVNSTIGDTTLKIQVFTRHLVDGSETDLFEITSPTIENTADYAILRFEGSQIAFTVLETDRVGIRIKGSTTRTQNTTINYIIGDGRGLYITTPLQIRHSQLRDLNGDTNYLHVTSTEKSTLNNSVPYNGATTNVDLGINYLNANTIKLDGTELLIDVFKSGSLGGAGNIFYSTGASSQPASGTVNQVIGNNYIQNQNDSAQAANMWINGLLTVTQSSTIQPRGIISENNVNGLNSGTFLARKSRGTPAQKLAVTSGNSIGNMSFSGYDGVEYKDHQGIIQVWATEDFVHNSNYGTELSFELMPKASGYLINKVARFTGEGNAYIMGTIEHENAINEKDGVNLRQLNAKIGEHGLQQATNVNFRTTTPLESNAYMNVFRNGSNSVGEGGYFGLISKTTVDQNLIQLNSDIGVDIWNYVESRGSFLKTFNLTKNGTLTIPENLISKTLNSTVPTGTPPLVVSSSSLNTNLNADLLDGQHGSYYQTASSKIKLTPEGGYAILLTNKTGANSVKGTVVYADPDIDNAFEVNPINGDMPFGVVYESGITDDSECWVVVAGIAEVLLVNTVASTRSHIAYSSGSVAGRIDTSATVPDTTTHFREIGHTMESKTGGTDVLIKCLLHFN